MAAAAEERLLDGVAAAIDWRLTGKQAAAPRWRSAAHWGARTCKGCRDGGTRCSACTQRATSDAMQWPTADARINDGVPDTTA